ncbi:MAG TPA: pyruvate carboxylase subunit B [Candidatus Dormibacteraeota bacterium]|nr:pyruvate carboxylase subunit B [Candidatus Dormibacteraeota bacterium]
MPRVLITETVLRDAQQSLVQGRLKLQHVLPIAKTLDDIGYHALDAWGGWTFAASVRGLNEDPWQRLRALRGVIEKTPLQMLIRGQTLISQSHQPDDVVRAFIEQAVHDGIRVVRMFDPLNDLRNLEVPIEAARKAGARVIAALVFSPSPVEDEAWLVRSANRLKALGADWIGIEDVAGILAPATARTLVNALVGATKLPVSIHTHSTTGLAPITYYAAIEAGASGVDTALSSLAWGASQPATETMVAALHDGPYDTGLDLSLISQASRYFDEIHDEYLEFQDPIAFRNDVYVLEHQLPAPVLAVIIRTLRERNALDRYDRLMQELVHVRQEMGYPPMAAPINRIAANQALSNTLSEKRYQHIDQPFRDYVKGLYGASPAPIDREVRKRALGSSEAITLRPADLLQPGLDRARREMRKQGLTPTGVDQVLTYILFPEEAPAILRPSLRRPEPAPATAAAAAAPAAEPASAPAPVATAPEPAAPAEPAAREFTVEVDGEPYKVRILGDGVAAAPTSTPRAATPSPAAAPAAGGDGAIQAPMQGMVVKVKVGKGDRVRLGDVVVVLEAMKMQNDIVATVAGTVREVFAKEGAIVAPNDVLMTIG